MAGRLPAGTTGLGSLSTPLRSLMKVPVRRLRRQVETQLVEHLGSIGISAERLEGRDIKLRRREARDSVLTMRLLAHARVSLGALQSVEVWRVATRARNEDAVLDKITYLASLEEGLSLTRIPLLTNVVMKEGRGGTPAFRWCGFEWGKLPLLAERLAKDTDLNRRLIRHFTTDTPPDLRITACPEDRVGFTTTYDPQRLPSREFLACLDRIIVHVNEYVAEQGRYRDAFVSRWQQRLMERRRQ